MWILPEATAFNEDRRRSTIIELQIQNRKWKSIGHILRKPEAVGRKALDLNPQDSRGTFRK